MFQNDVVVVVVVFRLGGGGAHDSLWSGELSNFQTRLRGSKTKEMNY